MLIVKGKAVKGPNTVRSGLVLQLDAGNHRSYPGSGTAWTDMSGLGNTGTLTNGPTFNSANGGSIVFDGTNDYVSIPYINSPFRQTSQITYDFWAYKGVSGVTNIMGTSVAGGGGTGAVYFNSDTSIFFYWCPSNPLSDRQISATVSNTLNTWNNYSFTINYQTAVYQWYQNGVALTSTLSNSVTTYTPATSYNRSFDDYVGGWYVNSPTYYTGRIASVSIYNRALTAAEVLQNYNALRSRFGL